MTTTSDNNKRIAKNTMFLYIRMVIIMLVQLYTSRVILQTLGIEDYGIYNIVGAVVVSLSFITGPLSSATQRFLSFELGKKNTGRIKDIFSMSLIVYGILSIVLLLFAETVGLWFLNHKMEIPPERLYAANWVFQCSIITFIINILNIPFNSAIIAYEKMSFYAYISIFEAIAKLAIVYFLLLYTEDKLILYGILVVIVTLSVTTIYKLYCGKYLKDIKIRFVRDKQLLKQLLSFSGWSLFGSVANMSADQGLNLLLNLFFGVTVNAAMGIANQVSAAVNQFVVNFQTAFNPQIVKTYAQGNMKGLHELICKSSKYSFLLLFLVVCPIFFNIEFILHLWLGNDIPTYAPTFCKLMLISLLTDALAAPLWASVNATGKIKVYQLCISLSILSNIFISFIFLQMGYPPFIVFIIKCIVTACNFLIRIYFTQLLLSLSVSYYFKKVLLRVGGIIFPIIFLLNMTSNHPEGWKRLILTTLLFLGLYFPSIFFAGLDMSERKTIKHFLTTKFK